MVAAGTLAIALGPDGELTPRVAAAVGRVAADDTGGGGDGRRSPTGGNTGRGQAGGTIVGRQ